MKQVVRSSVFETNSSSTHSIVVRSTSLATPTDEQAKKEIILNGEVEGDVFSTWYEKANYLVLDLFSNYEDDEFSNGETKKKRNSYKKKITQALQEKFPGTKVSFTIAEDPDRYSQCGYCLVESINDFYDIIFNDNNLIVITES